MNSSLRARIGTALLLAAVVVVVLLWLPPIVATALISVAIFAAGWEWAGFARLESAVARVGYGACIVLASSLADVLARDRACLELMLRAAVLWWLAALLWITTRSQAGGRIAAAVAGFFVLVPAGLGLERLVELQPHGPRLLLYLLICAAQLRLRGQFESTAPERLQIRMWLHPWGTLLAIAGILAIMVFMGITDDLASQLWLSLLVAAGFVLTYYAFGRHRAA